MNKAADVPIENSYFYTTRKDLDSLSFNADKAEYDISTQQLKVSGIPYIIVADAKITPENNEVLILENAKIGQLKNTVIVLDTINGYHRLTNGVVDIISRKEFTGHATYQYVNSVNDTFAIDMTDFKYEIVEDQPQTKNQDKAGPAMQTVANGVVTESSDILIAPRIYYKGDMTMYATKPALQLRGFVKMDLKKIKNYNTWLRYEQSGDEKDIYLNFDNALTEDGERASMPDFILLRIIVYTSRLYPIKKITVMMISFYQVVHCTLIRKPVNLKLKTGKKHRVKNYQVKYLPIMKKSRK